MQVDVIKSYEALNEFLKPRGYEIVPDGIVLKIMCNKRHRAEFVCDTIQEASDWVADVYNKRIIVEV